jgi:hypothetical protein
VIDAAPILSADQVANLMRCSVSTIENKARTGEIPGVLWGDGGWVFPAAALYERLNQIARQNAQQRCLTPEAVAVATQVRQSRARRAPPSLPSLGAAS